MTATSSVRELKLHSPAGIEPAVFTWPNIERQVYRLGFILFCLFSFNSI